MQGFDPEFTDLPDYIYRITERIWEGRQIGKISAYYARQCPVRSPAGLVSGSDAVITATLATLAEFPDRRLLGEDVIWKGDDQNGYLSSHRILSTATHAGGGAYGRPTHKRLTYRIIADCWVRQNQVIEEWLVRDQGAIAIGLGLSPQKLAAAQLARGERGVFTPAADVASAYALPPQTQDADAAAYLRLYEGLWQEADLSLIPRRYHDAATLHAPSAQTRAGHTDIDRFHLGYLAAFRSPQFTAHDLTVTENDNGKTAALRWSVSGEYSGAGAFAADSDTRANIGAPLHLMAISHARFRAGKIATEWLLADEIALWKQILPAPAAN